MTISLRLHPQFSLFKTGNVAVQLSKDSKGSCLLDSDHTDSSSGLFRVEVCAPLVHTYTQEG